METRQVGPSGGTSGEAFRDDITAQDYLVAEVHVYTQQQVNGIQIIHETCDGQIHTLPLHGCARGERYVLRSAADEFITDVSGRYGAQVDSICIETNKRASPRRGGMGGEATYRFKAPSGAEIVGFCGRAGESLEAIGVIMRRRGL